MIELKPLLRFDCFNESWTKGNLKDTLILKYGKDHKHLKNGNYPVLGSGGVMRYVDSFLCDKPSVLIGRKGTIDNPLYINKPFWTVDTLFYTEIRDNFIPYFIYLLAQKVKWKKYNEATGVPSLNTSSIYSIPVTFPDKIEQQKIADFLTSVDTKISQLTEKYRLLKDYKKGAMQQIFSQQIRFKDDDGNAFPDWEEKLLGDIATFTKGKSISKADISIDGMTPCIRYGELYTTYGEVIESVVSATNLPIKSLLFSKANDVIVPSSGETQWDIATAACVKLSDVAYSGDLTVIRTPLNGVFLSYYFNSAKKREIASLSQGSSVIHLYSTHLKSLKIEIPCEAEQQKIALFLQSLDKKINAVNEQIEQTKLFKKGLLQQMFV